jgi:hypothetical protein
MVPIARYPASVLQSPRFAIAATRGSSRPESRWGTALPRTASAPAKQTGLANLPFRDFAQNAVWVEISLVPQDLIAWTQRVGLDGELAVREPKTPRYLLLHTAARLAFHARRATLRLQRRLVPGPGAGCRVRTPRLATAAAAR